MVLRPRNDADSAGTTFTTSTSCPRTALELPPRLCLPHVTTVRFILGRRKQTRLDAQPPAVSHIHITPPTQHVLHIHCALVNIGTELYARTTHTRLHHLATAHDLSSIPIYTHSKDPSTQTTDTSIHNIQTPLYTIYRPLYTQSTDRSIHNLQTAQYTIYRPLDTQSTDLYAHSTDRSIHTL